ncbi:MAG: cytochrome c biogenesis protein CcdA [Candidatus Brocadiia bacterium]
MHIRQFPIHVLVLLTLTTALVQAGDPGAHAPGDLAEEDTRSGQLLLLYFYSPSCDSCERVTPLVQKLDNQYAGVKVRSFNIFQPESAELNRGLCNQRDLPERHHGTTPAVFAPEGQVVDRDITMASLLDLAEHNIQHDTGWNNLDNQGETGRSETHRAFDNLTLLMVFGAGLADGINPCALAVIIFFVTYMTYAGTDRSKILLVGTVYTLSVFLTYLAIGLGLHALLNRGMAASLWFRRIFYAVMVLLVFAAAGLSIRDAFFCPGDKPENMFLKLPAGLRRRIHGHMTRSTRRGATILGTVLLGIMVAMLEFPCTGQLYAPIITHLSTQPTSALAWLVLYNVCFITPLVAVFALVLFGVSSKTIQQVFRDHLFSAKIILSIIFLTLGIILILTFP